MVVGDLPRFMNKYGAGRDRTDDLLLAKQALYRLSYGPIYLTLYFA